jgi:hypothetical protein
MTFEEWWSDAIWGNEDFKRCCEIAWNAAVESEREAIAKWFEDYADAPYLAAQVRNRGTA